MLEPKRKIYVTDRQLEITESALQSALTETIEQLRQKYLKNLSKDQKKVFDNFLKYPPLYSIVILNLDTSLNKEEFKKEHLLPSDVKIIKRPNDDSKDSCSVILNFQQISAYYNFQKYFIQKKFEVLTNQRFNKTKEILSVFMNLYKFQFENKEDQQKQAIKKKQCKSVEDLDEIPSDENDDSQLGEEAAEDKNNKSLEMEIEIEKRQTQEISSPSLHLKENLSAEEVKINKILSNINMIIESSNRKIKQQFRLSKGQFSLLLLKTEYQNFLNEITQCKASNQNYQLLAQKFLIDFPSVSINNTLKSICRDYQIDGQKLII